MKRFFLFLVLLVGAFQMEVAGQNLPINIESLTDQQIMGLMTQYQLVGLSDLELEMKAREKGLSMDQINQLKKRMALMDFSSVKEMGMGAGKSLSNEENFIPRNRIKSRSIASYYRDTTQKYFPFGYEIFENEELSFEPNINIATPQNYIIGANDQLSIDVFGISDNTKKLTVSADGFIRYPNYGPIKVAGLTIEDAKAKIKASLTKIYPGIAGGAVNVQVALTKLRSIRVTLIGEVYRPGNFELSSLSTIMNALYASGGPNKIGSFRDIELVRNGKTIAQFDLYNFLLKSDLTKNKLLEDGDVIRISPYSRRVILIGAIKKQALFDVKDHETASDIIQYAGGFADHALKEWVRVYRMGQLNKEMVSVPFSQLNQFKLQSGDTLVIDSLANSYSNRILIGGAVYYPGAYGLQSFPSLKELLFASKPLEDAYTDRALLRRLKPDFTRELINFSIQDILTGKQSIELVREDSIHIFKINDLRENYTLTINGEVNKGGVYTFAENTRVQDLVLMAGGYRDGASLQRIEVSRRLRQQNGNKDSALYSVIKTIDLTNANNQDLNFVLQPFDIVSVRKSPLYKEQINVGIEGEIVFPGNYTLSGNTERISDLVRRAGGLKQNGFAGGALLIRKTYRDISETDATLISNKNNLINSQSGINAAANGAADSAAIAAANKAQKPVGIRLDEILSNPGSAEDLFLLEGDILKIPRQLQTIQTFGAVNVPKQIVYYEGIRFKDALRESGRFSMNASRKNSYVIYPNGQVRKTRSFLFIRSYPAIKPGTEIYVPAKKAKGKLSTGEVIGVVSSLTSLVSILVLLINSQK